MPQPHNNSTKTYCLKKESFYPRWKLKFMTHNQPTTKCFSSFCLLLKILVSVPRSLSISKKFFLPGLLYCTFYQFNNRFIQMRLNRWNMGLVNIKYNGIFMFLCDWDLSNFHVLFALGVLPWKFNCVIPSCHLKMMTICCYTIPLHF